MNASGKRSTGAADDARDAASEAPVLNIWRLALPSIAANLLFTLVGVVSIKIVGSLGASAVAAVTTGNRIFFAFQAILMAVGAGTTALVARAYGAGDPLEGARVTQASMALGIAIGAIMAVPFLLFAPLVAGIFGLPEETTALAADYIWWTACFAIVFAFNMILGSALRAAGDTITPLWVGVLTNIVNVILVYALVYGRFGLPALGVSGAAIASGIAMTVGAIAQIIPWSRSWLVIDFVVRDFLTPDRLRQLVHIGYPAGLEQVAFQAGFIGFFWIVALYGTEPFAAYGIGTTLLSISFVVGFGFSIAGSTMVGQSLGAGRPADATAAGWRAMRLAILFMTALSVAVALVAEPLSRFMIDDPEVVRLTVIFIYFMAAAQPMMAIEFAIGGALRGAGDTRSPLVATLLGLVAVRVSMAAVFALLELQVLWIFATLVFDYLVKGIFLLWRFHRGRWRKAIAGPRL